MITKEMKVSDVLKKYPETLEVFVKASPHFKKLKNKILRKALASRVTVQQAAAIAGVDLQELLFQLNKKINHDFTLPNSENDNTMEKIIEKPEWLQHITQERIVELDVRPIIDSGRDPFLNIMSKINELKKGQVLLLINSFEPIPLYTVLGKKGFDHYTEKEEDKFKVYFYKKEKDTSQNEFDNQKTITEIQKDYSNLIELDVRELPPPEPIIKILEILPQVNENTVLLVHHHREPLMLYPKLEERGYEAISNKINESYYKVLIFKKK